MQYVAKTIFICDKCGKEIEYAPKGNYGENGTHGCWNIYLGRAGYDSKLDGSEINFDLCDDCLYDFIHTFNEEGRERVLNSGSNTWYGDEQEDSTFVNYEED